MIFPCFRSEKPERDGVSFALEFEKALNGGNSERLAPVALFLEELLPVSIVLEDIIDILIAATGKIDQN